MSASPRLQIKTVAVREDGCCSALLWDGMPFGVSLERTFENRRVVIGNGIFLATPSFYHHGGYPAFELHIDGHDRVLLHKGAKEEDSMACVLLGKRFGGYDPLTREYSDMALGRFTQVAVLGSTPAYDELMKRAEGLSFQVWVNGR